MRLTDYWRIKEHLELIENSLSRLRRLLRYGNRVDIEMEAVFLESSCRMLFRLEKISGVIFDIRISRLKEEAQKLLARSQMEVQENG